MTTGCRQQDFGFFKDEWRRYADSADTQNNNMLRDQLLQCSETALRNTLQNTIGATRRSTITVDDLMKVKLMEAKQESDKPVRTFVARLRGLANICILFTQCTGDTCTKTVSHVEPTIHLALVKGLVDMDTKGEILSKLKQMDLDETVAFVEARETCKRYLVVLNGGPSSSQVNGIQVQGMCWRFGQEGHSGKAPAPIRKTTCKTYKSKRLKCSQVRHVTTNTVQILHSTVSTADINLCQFRVSGKEIDYRQAIRKQLRTRTNLSLPKEE